VTRVLVINGANLNLLGQREPDLYGRQSLAGLERQLSATAADLGLTLECFQSNAEHGLVERIHAANSERVDFLIINPGAFTHTSLALRDALLGVEIPFIEVHISNPKAREEFRHHSFLEDIAVGTIAGLGVGGYDLALRWIASQQASA